jgi:glutamyl-tRNA reductase
LEDQHLKEAILLSTCNRVEIISRASNPDVASKNIINKLSKYSNIEFDDLYERADISVNDSAIHHIFSVASALDSLVIGETQIVGQLKDAFRFSLSKEYCDQELSRALHYSFKCAAAVRNATSLGTGSVSVASTAVAKAKEIIKDTAGVKALVIGAGEMSELTIKHLLSSGFDVVLTSRDRKKAQILADTFEDFIQVEDYVNLPELLNEIPVMITATSAPYPIITQDITKNCSFERFWFDIAVPRDIEEIDSPNLMIYSVDDLQEIVNENMSLRAEQAKTAYQIVNKMSLEFFDWLKSLEVDPVIKNMYTRGDAIIDKKIKNALKKGFIDKESEENIRKLCQTVLTEYLHQPQKKIKSISKDNQCDIVVSTVQSVFGMDSETSFLSHDCNKINE